MKPARTVALCALALTVCAPTVRAQALSRPLTAAEIDASRSRLSTSLIDGIAGPLHVDTQQAFEVKRSGGEPVWIEPVRYDSKNPGAESTWNRCGIFFLFGKSPAVFVPTVGYGGMEAEQCGGLKAVGFSATDAAAPRLLLLYDASSPNADLHQPVILDWNAKSGRYELNEALSNYLEDAAEATSIAGMKKALLRYKASE
jgi:hypothetical protein